MYKSFPFWCENIVLFIVSSLEAISRSYLISDNSEYSKIVRPILLFLTKVVHFGPSLWKSISFSARNLRQKKNSDFNFWQENHFGNLSVMFSDHRIQLDKLGEKFNLFNTYRNRPNCLFNISEPIKSSPYNLYYFYGQIESLL